MKFKFPPGSRAAAPNDIISSATSRRSHRAINKIKKSRQPLVFMTGVRRLESPSIFRRNCVRHCLMECGDCGFTMSFLLFSAAVHRFHRFHRSPVDDLMTSAIFGKKSYTVKNCYTARLLRWSVTRTIVFASQSDSRLMTINSANSSFHCVRR